MNDPNANKLPVNNRQITCEQAPLDVDGMKIFVSG